MTASESSVRGESQAAYVFPGHVVVGTQGRLTTMLGSCVSVCLFDPEAGMGGMNHFLMPSAVGGKGWSARFAGPALQRLLGQLHGLGANPERLVAKLFGGCVPIDPETNGFHVGWQNVEAARRLLREERIPVLVEDVGGPHGRRLVFDTHDGSAWVRVVRRLG